MENCLTKNSDINVVYTINEPAAVGAYNALKQPRRPPACWWSRSTAAAPSEVGQGRRDRGDVAAVPLKMAALGSRVDREDRPRWGQAQEQRGPRLLQHGVALVTDKAATGVPSIDTTKGGTLCWG